jgi:alkanesulfonate monooxygenase SsuD/methylene tetrahydromethanopterin reductase-like flavin-dependent oxidoreductase (luciferase family)
MSEWADRSGLAFIVLSEHHGSEDGYLPSALTMAAAVAARTRQVHIQIAAVAAGLHDPLRLAEEVAVVDLISGGRLSVVVANGYVREEFAMFGAPYSGRVARTAETVATLRQAWLGEPFEFRGRTVRVTPSPHQPGGPPILLAGSSEGAARRAARIADGYQPSTPDTWEHYRDELRQLGKPDPGPYVGGDTGFVHLANDPATAWSAIAPFALHETNSYGRWAVAADAETGYQPETDPAQLRTSGRYRVLTPEEFRVEVAATGVAVLHPMMGGMPPELGWQSLRLLEQDVLPQLT